jgi:hypothetical protein
MGGKTVMATTYTDILFVDAGPGHIDRIAEKNKELGCFCNIVMATTTES